MNRFLILGVLAIAACFAGWYCVQQLHENAFKEELENALGAHAYGHDREAEGLLQALLPKAEKWWPNGPHYLETLCWVGTIHHLLHQDDLAEPEFRKVIAISEQQGATSTTPMGRAKLGLGLIARDDTDFIEAQKLFAEAAEILTKNPQAAWGDDASALLNLGYLASKQGHYPEAQAYLKRAISTDESLPYNVPKRELASAHFQLAEVYRQLDQFDLAAEQYKAALELFAKAEGPSGKDVRYCLTGLGIVQQGRREVPQAGAAVPELVSPVETTADLDGASLNNLANAARDRRQYREAETLYQKAAGAYENSGGPNDVGVATALANLGKLYRDVPQLDIRKAEPLLKRALAIRETALGADHPETAKILSDLSLLYSYEKKPSVAEEFARRSLSVEENTFGPESLPVSTTLNRLGIAQRDEGKLAEAESSLKRALAIREAQHAPQSWIAVSLTNLASVYELEGQEAQAAPLMTRARLFQASSFAN